MKKIINKILNGEFLYAWRRQKLVWYWNNLEAIKLFRVDRGVSELDEEQKRVIRDLRETGIAMSHSKKLFGIDAKNLPIPQEGKQNLRKTYFLEFSENFYKVPRLILDFNDLFIKLSLSRTALDIINNYLGMYSRFFEYTLAKISPTDKEPQQSQTWHRDAYDKKFVKMFIYLTDVDENSGPLNYIEKSHCGGKWHKIYPQKGMSTTYLPPNPQLPRATMCTGSAGTVIFADTAGIHYGGLCKTNSRIMFTASYRTNGAPIHPTERLYGVPRDLDITNPAIRYAVYL